MIGGPGSSQRVPPMLETARSARAPMVGIRTGGDRPDGRRLASLASWLASLVGRERFAPSPLGIFLNPNFPTRRRIAAFVRRHAHLLKGDVLDFGGGEMPYRGVAEARSWRSLEYAPSLGGPDLNGLARQSRLARDHLYYDGHTIPLPDNAVDTVLATEVLEHVFNLEQILAELHRVLKPGGRLVATLPFAMYEHEVPHDFARYTSFAVRDRLERTGFVVESLEKLSACSKSGCRWQHGSGGRRRGAAARSPGSALPPCRS